MSAPPSRIRTKTSDFTQFFRGQTPRQHEPVASPPVLVVPDGPEPATPKKSKLPFLGRTRKKSTQSVQSGTAPSTGRGYESEVTELPSSKKEKRLSQPVPSPEPTVGQPPLPTTNAIPHINISSPSLGSKFVAHFSNSKLRKNTSSLRAPRDGNITAIDGNTTDTLSPPTDARTASFDSTTTAASVIPPRSAVIAIASTPTKFDEYRNMFTLPNSKKPVATKRLTTTPASEYRDKYHKTESSVTLTPSSPSSPHVEHSIPATTGSTHHETRPRDTTRRLVDSAKSSKIAKKRTTGPKVDEEFTPEGSVDDSGLTSGTAPAIDVTPPAPISKLSSPTSPRLRKRASPAIKEARASTPPSIPLPAPPSDDASSFKSTVPRSSPKLPSLSPPIALAARRPRANTIGSVPHPSLVTATATTGPSSRTSNLGSHLETSDLDSLTVKQLKEALVQRNQQYGELTTHLLEVNRNFAAEKAALEKKITTLDAELLRKDKEIQGLTWMLNGRSTQSPIDNDVDYTRIPGPRIQRSPSVASSKMSSQRVQQTDDSGAESPSGTESIRSSGISVSSVSRLKKGLRPLTLGESSQSIYQSSIMNKSSLSRGPAVDNGHSEPRSSLYSLSSTSSSTSSNSSPYPPSPSIPMSSLSAIPEVSAVMPSKVPVPRISTSPTRDSFSTSSDWDTDLDKKPHDIPVRASRRISGSSFSSSSSSAATSAYSANLKRGRPPSIAQVLQKTPTMDDVLGKLRPFTSTAPAATCS